MTWEDSDLQPELEWNEDIASTCGPEYQAYLEQGKKESAIKDLLKGLLKWRRS